VEGLKLNNNIKFILTHITVAIVIFLVCSLLNMIIGTSLQIIWGIMYLIVGAIFIFAGIGSEDSGLIIISGLHIILSISILISMFNNESHYKPLKNSFSKIAQTKYLKHLSDGNYIEVEGVDDKVFSYNESIDLDCAELNRIFYYDLFGCKYYGGYALLDNNVYYRIYMKDLFD
jgi:energy-coupling factor transporter transmembrane protein EcfT